MGQIEMDITSLEASFKKYLRDNLEVAQGIKVFDDVNKVDPLAQTQWVVIDPLRTDPNILGRSLYFLQIAVQKQDTNERLNLNKLVSKVCAVVNEGVNIDGYDFATGLLDGSCLSILDTSLSPVLVHSGGGSFRSLTVDILYNGNN